jgi:hypothetical protein
VAGLPSPGGNLTGFITSEASFGGKWLELLTEIAPGVKRVAMTFNRHGSLCRVKLPALIRGGCRSLKVASIAAPFIATPKSKRS